DGVERVPYQPFGGRAARAQVAAQVVDGAAGERPVRGLHAIPSSTPGDDDQEGAGRVPRTRSARLSRVGATRCSCRWRGARMKVTAAMTKMTGNAMPSEFTVPHRDPGPIGSR